MSGILQCFCAEFFDKNQDKDPETHEFFEFKSYDYTNRIACKEWEEDMDI